MRKRILFASSPEAAAIAERIDELMASADFSMLKATPRTVAGIIRYGRFEAFVKRVDAGNWLKGVADRIRGSRAAWALRGADLLARAGFAHPRPIAALEWRSFGAIQTSYVLSEKLADARILSLFALTDGRNFPRRKWFSERLARELRRLHEAGLYTRDLQETNLMLAAKGDEMVVYFVDLEDFRHAFRVSLRRRMLNLVHLDRSIGRFVSRSQRLRFFYNYLGGKPDRQEARRQVARLLEIRARIERRSRVDLSMSKGGTVMAPADATGAATTAGLARAGAAKN
jgi:tRNA A-37 threonylcarbamoyl transferase component Bud32